MATFESSKGYHFSEDGTKDTTWAHFELVPFSDPARFRFETDDAGVIGRLAAVPGIVAVEAPAPEPVPEPAPTGRKG